jgi:putative colanic acid biosynthesis acetyltransferase WcaF
MQLDSFDSSSFDRGAPRAKELLWFLCCWLLLSSGLPGSDWRSSLLRLFGARVGRGVNFKPGVRVKFPWRLVVGDHCWIGEDVWIDNLAEVAFEDHVCVSQGAYFCTGSHDWSKSTFDLIVKPINIGAHAWISAKSVVAPGVRVGEGAVLGLGSVATHVLDAWAIYAGNPAKRVKTRSRTA